MYRLLLAQPEALLVPGGPLDRFAQDEIRVLFRATRTYGRLLQESFHPDVLRDALDRDRLLDRLWVGVDRQPALAKIIPAEHDALLRGDIPRFTTHVASRDLWGDMHAHMAAFFDESGMDRVRHRLLRLCDADHAHQLWFIRATLAMLALNVARTPYAAATPPAGRTTLDRSSLLAAAQRIGDRLAAQALHGTDDAGWIGLTPLNDRAWSVAPLDIDLYDGLPGVALFLAYLGAITGQARHTALARAALRALRWATGQKRGVRQPIGGFTGWGGVIYTLTHLGALWQEPALLAEAEGIAARLAAFIAQDDQFDIIAGAAGCIGGLLSLYRLAPTPATIAAAVQCGDRLLAAARPCADGAGWIPAGSATRPLTGFAHGAAGIAWALLELAAMTGESRFRAAALAGIAYERTQFCQAVGNWPDLRELALPRRTSAAGEPPCMTAWCHGAPGIGLARLLSLPHLDDAAIRAEIDVAVRTTLAQGFGQNHSLCHGDFGNLDFLLQASLLPAYTALRRPVRHLASAIVARAAPDRWICGGPAGIESPGLMTGLAGIGYALLRLAEPTHVPSVVVLAPPALASVDATDDAHPAITRGAHYEVSA
jgi:type 2 lantibiotic biosynthesis protein LanM